MPFDERLADRVREILARVRTDVEEKKMFGGLCFMVDDKMCVGVARDSLMVRFDPERNAEIMELDGAGPMDFTTRVMRGFAFVEPRVLERNSQLEFWVALALEFNKKAKASRKKPKRKS